MMDGKAAQQFQDLLKAMLLDEEHELSEQIRTM